RKVDLASLVRRPADPQRRRRACVCVSALLANTRVWTLPQVVGRRLSVVGESKTSGDSRPREPALSEAEGSGRANARQIVSSISTGPLGPPTGLTRNFNRLRSLGCARDFATAAGACRINTSKSFSTLVAHKHSA